MMNRFVEYLTELNKIYSPHRRPDPETKRILVESVRMIRSNPKIYNKLSEYQAFQEIVSDKRFSKYLSEVNGSRNPEFISVMTFKSVSGELPRNFVSRIQISTLPYFERDLLTKLLELYSILKSNPLSKHGWKSGLSQEDISKMLNTTSRTVRARRKKSELWRDSIQPDPAHPKKWQIKSCAIQQFRKELNS